MAKLHISFTEGDIFSFYGKLHFQRRVWFAAAVNYLAPLIESRALSVMALWR